MSPLELLGFPSAAGTITENLTEHSRLWKVLRVEHRHKSQHMLIR
jgi:hypothetical protein